MIRWIRSLFSSYLFIISAALVAGVTLAGPAELYLAPYTTYFLGAILFFSALHIDLSSVLRELKQPGMVLVISIFVIGVIPVAVFYATQLLIPELAVGFLILTAMPASMTAPFLTEMAGGKQSLALVVTVVTSLVAPLTVPLLLSALAGQQVVVPFADMVQSLAIVIFVPFVLAQVVRSVAGITRLGKQAARIISTISLLLLGLLVAGIISSEAERFVAGLESGTSLLYLAWLFGLFALFHVGGYMIGLWRPFTERVAIIVSLSYMNFTLAVYLVDLYFTEPNIVIPVVLSVIPWALLFGPFEVAMKYVKKSG